MEFIIKAGTFFLQAVYQCMKLFPVKDKITMISRQSNTPSVDFLLVKDEISRRSPGTEVVLLCRTLDGGADATVWNKLGYGIHMLTQMYHLATSKVILLDTYCIVASLLHHRKSLKIVQMWHSMGTMKLFGYTAVGSQEGSSARIAELMHMHANYDYFIAASPNYQAHLARGFRCDEKRAFICPLPRYDLLRDREYKEKMRCEIWRRYPGLKDRKVILYCPTFRKDEKRMGEALDRLIACLPEGFELIVKLHPLSEIRVSDKRVWTLEGFSTFDALFAADYVISDYSCVVYEAGILKLPLCFYIFDYDQYTGKRGFAISFMDEVKGVISADPGKIMEAIKDDRFDMDEISSFIGKYVQETESAAGKLTDFLLQIGRIKSE